MKGILTVTRGNRMFCNITVVILLNDKHHFKSQNGQEGIPTLPDLMCRTQINDEELQKLVKNSAFLP